ncbi:hypothetical protein ACLOJK_020336 [Asimina triloba]
MGNLILWWRMQLDTQKEVQICLRFMGIGQWGLTANPSFRGNHEANATMAANGARITGTHHCRPVAFAVQLMTHFWQKMANGLWCSGTAVLIRFAAGRPGPGPGPGAINRWRTAFAPLTNFAPLSLLSCIAGAWRCPCLISMVPDSYCLTRFGI